MISRASRKRFTKGVVTEAVSTATYVENTVTIRTITVDERIHKQWEGLAWVLAHLPVFGAFADMPPFGSSIEKIDSRSRLAMIIG